MAAPKFSLYYTGRYRLRVGVENYAYLTTEVERKAISRRTDYLVLAIAYAKEASIILCHPIKVYDSVDKNDTHLITSLGEVIVIKDNSL